MAEETAGFLLLKGLKGLRIYTNPKAAAGKTPIAYRESEVTRNRVIVRQNSRTQVAALTLSEPSPTQSYRVVKWVTLLWQLPKAPPHTIYRCLFYIGHATKTGSHNRST